MKENGVKRGRAERAVWAEKTVCAKALWWGDLWRRWEVEEHCRVGGVQKLRERLPKVLCILVH